MTESTIPSEINKLKPYLSPHLANRLTKELSFDDVWVIAEHITSLRNVLSTYLPRYLVDLINEDPTPGQVSCEFRHGTVMFADVSGFTAMSEKLSVLGKEGAEEITSIVDRYFDAMLEIGDQYGGDLLKFGGDALLIFFEGDDGPHHALAAATLMQESMTHFAHVETSQGVFPLRMSIGIASGSVFLASLGSPGNMYYSVMGHALTRMAQAEDRAAAGQIVVDQSTHGFTKEIANFKLIGDTFWLVDRMTSSVAQAEKSNRVSKSMLPDPEVNIHELVRSSLAQMAIIEGLSSYVPTELMARLVVEPQRPILHGSHRPVTVMFANYQGMDEMIDDLGPDHKKLLTDILNTYLLSMNHILARYGGTISRLDPYVVGHRIMGLFGALRAHEDDPQRAVRAALEMNQALGAVNQEMSDTFASIPNLREVSDPVSLKQRIGINTGFVFAGNVGTATRREYTVMGDQVNLTARLMSLAKEGEVLIGQSTLRHTEGLFLLEEKEAVEVKGITEPVRNFVVLGLEERPQEWAQLASIPFVGRERELIRGRQAVERTLQGAGGVLVIKGTSGIGKTRLAEEITSFGVLEGMDLLVGSCLSYGKTMTYHPWVEILKAHFGILATDDTRSRMQALQSGMQAIDEVEWTPVIGPVIGMDIPDNKTTRDLDAKLRRQRVLDLSVKLLQTRAQHRPLIVVVDDVQWADPASMDLISYVARNIAGHPILLILAHRPDEDLPDWSNYPHGFELVLGDLSQNACMEIVQSMIGPIKLPDAACQLVLRKTSGNPFFIGEVIRAMIDADALQRDASGKWRMVRDMVDVDLPDTIHGIIISRIDRLDTVDRRLLQVGSVVGRNFTQQTLTGVYDFHDKVEEIETRLSYLQQSGLIERHDAELEGYRFVHLTTREVVYESLSFDLRRNLHCDIGDFIESSYADALFEQTPLLAYHYYEGHAWPKAMEYNLLAGHNAQREFANETAITSCFRVLEAVEELDPDTDTFSEQLAAHETLGEVMTLVGRYEEAISHYTSAKALLEAKVLLENQIRRLADLCRKIAEVHERRSEYDIAFEWLDKGRHYLMDLEPTIEMANIYLLGAGIYRRQGKNDEAMDWCQSTLDIGSQIKTRDGQQVVAKTYFNLSGINWRRGDFDQAVDYCLKSVDLYQEIDDKVGLSNAYLNLSNAYADLSEWDKAIEALLKSMTIKEKIGDVFYQAALANNLGEIYRDRGQWDQALEQYEKAREIWERIGATLFEGLAFSNLGQVYIYQGNWSAAQVCLNHSQALYDETGSDDYLSELDRRWGEYYLNMGDLDLALYHAQQAIELASTQEERLDMGIGFRVLGEIHRVRNEFEEAEIAMLQSLRLLDDLGSEYEAAKTRLSITQLALASGKEMDANQLQKAITTFKKLEARAEFELASDLEKQLGELR